MTDLVGPFDGVPWSQSQWYSFAPLWSASGILGSPQASAAAGPFGVTAVGLNVTVTCAGQRAWVRGAGYQPDTDKTLAVAANSNSSLFRRDRLVIRRNLATQTVTIERLLGTALGSSPSAPALTQVEAGIWEIPICSFLVPPNNGTALSGFVDERVWLDPTINPRDLNARLTAEETKAAGTYSTLRLTSTGDAFETGTNHAFQIGPDNGLNFIIDQNEMMARDGAGGLSGFGVSATNFSITGTGTVSQQGTGTNAITRKDYVDNAIAAKIQSGSAAVSLSNTNGDTGIVSFPSAFSSKPRVTLTVEVPANSSIDLVAVTWSVTATSFNWRVRERGATAVSVSATLHWIATL